MSFQAHNLPGGDVGRGEEIAVMMENMRKWTCNLKFPSKHALSLSFNLRAPPPPPPEAAYRI